MFAGFQRLFRRWWQTGRLLGLGLLVALVVLRIADPPPVEVLRLRTFDFYQTISPLEHPDQPVAIVDIDDASLNALGQWPWPRHYLAQIVANLMKAGALVVGFDMVF